MYSIRMTTLSFMQPMSPRMQMIALCRSLPQIFFDTGVKEDETVDVNVCYYTILPMSP